VANPDRTYSGLFSLTALTAARDIPSATAAMIHLAWHHDLAPHGHLDRWSDLGLQVVDVVRLAAIGAPIGGNTLADLIEAAPPPEASELNAISTAATVALREPSAMRWISANSERVAEAPNWHPVVTGLAGLTVSVPLAEEALTHLMRRRAELPRDIALYVQLNPWFSKRFAVRFRRRIGGKRARIRERGATARAWSHARTLLGDSVPFEWSSLHGRGAGRPLDEWSHRLLNDYVDLLERLYPESIPPTVASLYAISTGAISRGATHERVTAGWHLLPIRVVERSRAMAGIPPSDDPRRSRAEARVVDIASRALANNPEPWRELLWAAYGERRGLIEASRGLIPS